MAYHKNQIPKGELGQFSKIEEEFLELKDAVEQNDKILQICELSDLIGAIESFLLPNKITILDLIRFSDKTKSAFKDGKR